jgi:hypothetical protein
MLVRSVWSVRLEPVHDQTGDFDFALEVREVPDIGQDNIFIWPLEERLNRYRVPRRRIGAAINCGLDRKIQIEIFFG